MKSVSVILLCTLCAYVYAGAINDEQYTTKYDNIDLDQILKSDRLLRSYVNCLLNKGKCTKDGEDLKIILPDAIHTGCSKCSEIQKAGAKKVVNFLIKNKSDWWTELEAVYDPDGTYRKQYESQINAEFKN